MITTDEAELITAIIDLLAIAMPGHVRQTEISLAKEIIDRESKPTSQRITPAQGNQLRFNALDMLRQRTADIRHLASNALRQPSKSGPAMEAIINIIDGASNEVSFIEPPTDTERRAAFDWYNKGKDEPVIIANPSTAFQRTGKQGIQAITDKTDAYTNSPNVPCPLCGNLMGWDTGPLPGKADWCTGCRDATCSLIENYAEPDDDHADLGAKLRTIIAGFKPAADIIKGRP